MMNQHLDTYYFTLELVVVDVTAQLFHADMYILLWHIDLEVLE